MDTIEEEVAEVCDACGDSLEGCDKELDYVTQIISLPELKPLITEVRHYVKVCRTCGKRVKSHTKHGNSPYNAILALF